jgi:hypothetical protein
MAASNGAAARAAVQAAALRLVLAEHLHPFARMGVRTLDLELKKCYRSMAQLVHPDHHGNSSDATKAMQALTNIIDTCERMSAAEAATQRQVKLLDPIEYAFYVAWCAYTKQAANKYKLEQPAGAAWEGAGSGSGGGRGNAAGGQGSRRGRGAAGAGDKAPRSK